MQGQGGEEIEAMLRLAGRDGMDGTVRGWDRSYLIGKARAKACEPTRLRWRRTSRSSE